MEWIFWLWIIANIVMAIYQVIDAYDNWILDYPVWRSIPMFVLDTWEDMEYEYRLTGRIIVAVLLFILTLPAMILTAIFILVFLIVIALPVIVFDFLFKKR